MERQADGDANDISAIGGFESQDEDGEGGAITEDKRMDAAAELGDRSRRGRGRGGRSARKRCRRRR